MTARRSTPVGSAPDSSARRPTSPRRTTPRRSVVLGLLLLGGLSLLSAAPTWLSTTASTALDASVDVSVSGTSAAPGVSAAALVVVAAALSLGLVGRVARWVSLAVVALGGAVIAGSALSFVLSPGTAARSGVAEATGVARPAPDVDLSVAPYVTVVLGVAVLGVALWAAFGPVDWGSRSRRYDAPAAAGPTSPAAPGAPGSGAEGRGTARDDALRGTGDPSPDTRAGEDGPEPVRDALDERDTWDSLTQGDDPT